MQIKAFLTRLLSVLLISGAGALIVVAVLRAVGPLPLSIISTVTQKENLFVSTGRAELEVVPDEAQVSVGITIQRSTVSATQEEANRVINAITRQLQSLGIKKEQIKTSNYSIYPNYDYNQGAGRIIGYNINSNLEIKLTDFELLNAVIDTATREGANQVGGVQFTLSKEKEAELKNQARQVAIKDAQESAQELARLSGIRLGRVVDVQENRDEFQPPMQFRQADTMVLESKVAADPTSVEPGSTTYSYRVSLSYETY